MKKEYKLEINYQPLNKTWGVFFRNNATYHNEIDTDLQVAMEKMALYILSLDK